MNNHEEKIKKYANDQDEKLLEETQKKQKKKVAKSYLPRMLITARAANARSAVSGPLEGI